MSSGTVSNVWSSSFYFQTLRLSGCKIDPEYYISLTSSMRIWKKSLVLFACIFFILFVYIQKNYRTVPMQHTAKYPCDCVTLKLSVSTSEPSSQLVTTHQLLWVAISKELLVTISSTKCVSNSNIWQAWTSLCQVIRMPLGMICCCESGDSQLSCPSSMSQGLQKINK